MSGASKIQQIIALGGGGFSEEDNSVLDQYVLLQATTPNPRICFIPTASGDSESYVRRFYDAFRPLDCKTTHLSLFDPPTGDLRSFVMEQDVIYVGGGNTSNMLTLWREWGLDDMLKEAWQQGVVLCGISAGALCWFQEGLTDSIPGSLSKLSCLGLLRGSCCPHYETERQRRPIFLKMIAAGEMSPGYGVGDHVALHFVGAELKAAVGSNSLSRAYSVTATGSEALEDSIQVRVLKQDGGISL